MDNSESLYTRILSEFKVRGYNFKNVDYFLHIRIN